MNKIITLIMILNFAVINTALAQNDVLGFAPELLKLKAKVCAVYAKMNAQIMEERQSGISMSELMNKRLALDDEQGKKSNLDSNKIKSNMEMTRALIIKTYEIPRYETVDMRKKAIDDFANNTYLECSKQDEKSEEIISQHKISDSIENLASIVMGDTVCGLKANETMLSESIRANFENFREIQVGGKYRDELENDIKRIEKLTNTQSGKKSFCNRIARDLSAFFD